MAAQQDVMEEFNFLENVDFDEEMQITDTTDDEMDEIKVTESEIHDLENVFLENIPIVVNFTEETLDICVPNDNVATNNSPSVPTAIEENTEKYVCKKCNKVYKRKKLFEKHISLCKKQEKQKDLVDKCFFMEESEHFLQKALNDAVQDPFNSIAEPGLSVKTLAQDLLTCVFDTSASTVFFETLSNIFYNLINVKITSDIKCEELFAEFYKTTCCEKTTSLFNNLLSSLNIINNDKRISTMLVQYILDRYLFLSLELRNSIRKNDSTELMEDIKLSTDEEQTLRFVAGFIPFSLSNKYKNLPNSYSKTALLNTLKSWQSSKTGVTQKSFLDYTRFWIDEINRGGLFTCNDDFYIFIRRVENVCRTLLNVNLIINYCGENLSVVLLQKLNDSYLVNHSWNLLTRLIQSTSLKEKLKNDVLKKWINIRCYAFVKSWMEIHKTKLRHQKKRSVASCKASVASCKASVSLRKSL